MVSSFLLNYEVHFILDPISFKTFKTIQIFKLL